MQTNRKYKAVIIGCGNIAGGYDSPGDKNVFTHAHAISLHKRIVLSGVYDILHKKAKRFSRKWDTVPFTSIDEMFDNVHPDLVYVCVPTHAHLKVLENILTYKPRAVICEKPFGDDSNSAERMVTNYKKSSIPLLVNYNRRFDPVISRIKDNINRGYYGSFVNASLIYTKGILHNGCHVIDLLRYFFGEIRSYRILGANFDYKKEDPTLDVFLQFKGNIKAHLIAACELAYSIFEADFLFSKARIRLEQFGSKMILQVARDDRGQKPNNPSSVISPPSSVVRHMIFWPIFIGGLALDLWTKIAVFDWLESSGRESYTIIEGFLQLQLTVNRGAAFGIAEGRRWMLIAVSIGALIAIAGVLFSRIERKIVHVALGFLAAGVCGNLYDRLFNNGLVRDFIDVVYWPGKHWPAFNVADSMLCIAVGLLILSSFFTGQSSQKHAPPQK